MCILVQPARVNNLEGITVNLWTYRIKFIQYSLYWFSLQLCLSLNVVFKKSTTVENDYIVFNLMAGLIFTKLKANWFIMHFNTIQYNKTFASCTVVDG